MSGMDAALWAMKDAPVENVEEWAVLVVVAEHGNEDGTVAMPSQATIADTTRLSRETVKRRLRSLAARGIIARGDQRAAEIYPADKRPIVWDVLVPFSWFPNIDRIQRERAKRGMPPLTPADRPDIAEAPPKTRRVDAGRPRPRVEDGVSEDDISDDLTESAEIVPGGLEDRGALKTDGSSSGERGVYKTPSGGSTRPTTFPTNLPQDLPHKHPTPDGADVVALPGLDSIGAPRAAAAASPAPAVVFADFWQTYPRREARAAAVKAWDKAVRRADPARIVAGAARYRDDPNRVPAYTKHPTTWLNGDCWDDDPLPTRAGGQLSIVERNSRDIAPDAEFFDEHSA